MSLSGLNISMGILESDIPDVFGDALLVVSTWDPSYYTIDGSNNLTDVANPGQGSDWATFGWNTMDLVTDGDGTKWFTDPLSSLGSTETLIPATADGDAIVDTWGSDGLISIESYRAKADHTVADSQITNSGFSLNYNGKVVWRNLEYNAGSGTSYYDLEFYKQFTIGTLAAPYASDAGYFGVVKGGWGDGAYNPDGNTGFSPSYLSGDDIVVSWFLQSTGVRLMINGTFVTLWDAQERNADGTAADAAAEAAKLSQDLTPAQIYVNAGNTGVKNFNVEVMDRTKTDYIGIFRGNKADSYVAAAHSLLLNNKPT